MMKVLYFASSYRCGLTALCVEHAIAISGELSGLTCLSDGHEQYPGLAATLRRQGIAHEVIPGLDEHAHLPYLVGQVRAQIRRFRPDAIQVQTNWQLLLTALALRRSGVACKTVYWMHGFRHNYPLRSVLARVLIGGLLATAADRVIVSSSYTRRNFAFLGPKLWFSLLGVDHNYFQPYRPIAALPGLKRLIFAGQFRSGKNQEWLLRSLSQYCRHRGDRNVRLTLPGTGDLLGQCQSLARELGIEELVEFPGRLDRREMLEAYQGAHCALVPTNQETFGLSIAEPLVLGKIVFSRRVGCAEDFIKHGENGFVFDTQPELTALLLKILPDLQAWEHVGQRAFEQRHEFSWTTIAPSYARMLEQLCDGSTTVETQPRERAAAAVAPSASSQAPCASEETGAPARESPGRLKKILFFASSHRLGLTSQCVQHASAMAECGADFVCLHGEREQHAGLAAILDQRQIRHVVIPGVEFHDHPLFLIGRIRAQIMEFRPEVIHIQTNWQLLLTTAALRGSGVRCKTVYWMHGFRHNYPVRSIIAKVLIGGLLAATADRAIVSSSFNRRHFAFLGKKLWFSMIGVDEHFFQPYRPLETLPGPKRLIFAGEFRRGKNQDWLIRSLCEYCRESADRDVRLVLAGGGPLLERCRELARRLGVADLVEFPERLNRQQMLEEYQRAHCALVPTNRETFGSCIAEPLVLGKIVISRRVGCAEDVIVDGQNGFTFDTQPELTAVLLRVLPDLPGWEHVGRRAFEQRDIFRWKTITPAYFRMLQEP
jgi:glycosyltransferase involved in cell wall biosynthesis